MKINFKKLGVKSPDLLSKDNVIVYLSDSLISSMNYSGDASIIKKSTIIDSDFANELSMIKGYISLGTTGDQLRNAHVYSSEAKFLDGTERICYIQQSGDNLFISEYSGNRGAKYSSLYILLGEKLVSNKFSTDGNKFIIPRQRVKKFVEIVNDLIKDRQDQKLVLVPTDEVDSIMIKNEMYYYYKVYYYSKADENLLKQDEVADDNYDIHGVINQIADYSIKCNDLDVLELLEGKVNDLSELINNRINMLKKYEELKTR